MVKIMGLLYMLQHSTYKYCDDHLGYHDSFINY